MGERHTRADSLLQCSVALAVIALFLPAGETAAAAGPAELCSGGAPEDAPSSAALKQAAFDAEARLGAPGAVEQAADRVLADLKLAGGRGSPPDAAALASYCAAAGEASRVAASGSQIQAQAYLQAAMRYSEAASDAETAARAAFRLGLASVTPAGAPGTRGSRGARSSRPLPEPAQAPAPAAASNDDACKEVLSPAFLSQSSASLSYSALGCAVDRARSAGRHEIAALSQLRMARLSFTRAERAGAAADELKGQAALLAAEGLVDAQKVQDRFARAELLGRLAEQAIDAGFAAQPIVGRAVQAMSEAGRGDKGAEAFAAALAGRLWLARGDSARAAASFREAAFLESQRNQPLRLADWFLLLAGAEPDKRDMHILQAYRSLEAVRPLLPTRDPLTEESTFSLRMRPVFEAAVEVQLAGPAGSSESEQIAGAQRIIEAFRQAEIQSTLGSNCVPPRDPVKPADLRPGEILLYPILLEDRVELIYAERVDGAAPTYKRIGEGAKAGRRSVAQLVAAMANSVGYGSDDSWRSQARQLYDVLIKPLESRLGEGSTLIIVPDAPLRPLPFAALLGPDGRYLIEKTRLSIAPALSYSEPGIEHKKAPFVVAASLEQDVSLPSGFFPALLGAEDEAKVAAGLEGGARPGVFLEDFRRDELARTMAASRAQVLHLATHAAFNGRSDRSFIVANGSAIPISELRGLLSGSRSRGELLDLIVLSACETAVGDDQASMGLAGAAVQAGARSAIASLWQVSDAGTVELMRGFYRNYRAGEGKAEALRNAQLALIRKGGEFADPSVWAAFALLGGWR